MWDFSEYSLDDLFKIRDACVILKAYGLENEDMLQEINAQLERITKDDKRLTY